MAQFQDLLQRLVAWLRLNQLDPPLREFSLCSALPHSAYPALAVLPGGARFSPSRQCASMSVTLRIACCSGRPSEAQAQAQSAALQLKQRLEASRNLGGLARALEVGEVRLETARAASASRSAAAAARAAPFVQVAELQLKLLFHP